MKITKKLLKRIIKEELEATMKERVVSKGGTRKSNWKTTQQSPEEQAAFKAKMAGGKAPPAQPAAAQAQAQPAADTSQVAAELAKKLKPYFPPGGGMATAVITALVQEPEEAGARETFPSQFEEKLIRAWGFIKKQIAHEQRDNPDLKETDVYIAMARDEGLTDEYIRKIAGGAG